MNANLIKMRRLKKLSKDWGTMHAIVKRPFDIFPYTVGKKCKIS